MRIYSTPQKTQVVALGGPRQAAVLRLLVAGKSNKEIAFDLSMAESTVKHHVSRILVELNLSNRTEVTRWALLNPDVFAGAVVETSIHPAGCKCETPYCATMRAVVEQQKQQEQRVD